MELEMPSSFPKENVVNVAEVLYNCIFTTVVRMIVKQHEENPKKCAVRIVRKEELKETLANLAENGYTEGPGESAEFSLREGQRIQIQCTGNIEDISNTDKSTTYPYLSYMGGTVMDMTLCVKDHWKQKDLPAYVGSVRCTVLRDDSTEQLPSRMIELTISLPKPVRPRTAIGVAKVRLPYYLTSLVPFLSRRLCEEKNQHWQEVLKSLLGKSEFSAGYRIAKRKSDECDEESICRDILRDWMKTQAVHSDKLTPIIQALKVNGTGELAESCMRFVKFQKESLSDAVLSDLAESITKDVRTLGSVLGVPYTTVNFCINQHEDSVKEQRVSILMEWRELETMARHGENALEILKTACH